MGSSKKIELNGSNTKKILLPQAGFDALEHRSSAEHDDYLIKNVFATLQLVTNINFRFEAWQQP